MASSAAAGRSTLPRAVGDYSSRSSFTPFGGFGGGGHRTPPPFPERPASGRSAAPTYRGSEEILSNEYENDPDLGPGSDDQQFAGRSSGLPPVRFAVGVEAAGRRRGSGPPDSVDHLEAFNRPSLPRWGRSWTCLRPISPRSRRPPQTCRSASGRDWLFCERRWHARAGVGAESPLVLRVWLQPPNVKIWVEAHTGRYVQCVRVAVLRQHGKGSNKALSKLACSEVRHGMFR
ncbi:unnamed protein product [Phytophthora fragariaefolia]|uniref:Unnamed protein product n=1 Tax=Phytophthora fragariaefolia TaxID=1490495 RepID=A0A9W6Y6S4_9STRA|nr:unnamed protein product [Phytophthora fragariaefolia]